MRTRLVALQNRLTTDLFDRRLAQLVCAAAAIAIVPLSVLASARHSASGPESLLCLGLTSLLVLLCLMLAIVSGRVSEIGPGISVWRRWPEFTSYIAGLGILVSGIRLSTALAPTPMQITLGVLLSGALCMAVLVFGMMTTLSAARNH